MAGCERKLISGGLVVTAEQQFHADVLVVGESIAAVGVGLAELADEPCERIDATGLYVLPGGVDTHTHMKMPAGPLFTIDDYTTGTAAAVCGGTTTIIDFAVQGNGTGPAATIERWRERLRDSPPYVDVGFHLAVTSLDGAAAAAELAALPAQGVTSFKLFMAYPGTLMVGDRTMLEVMRVAAASGAQVMVHAENGDLVEMLIAEARAAGHTAPVWHARTRPPAAEAEATHRAIALAAATGCPLYVVHVSCAASLAEVVAARSRGQRVLAETCSQYLLFSEADLDRPGFEGAKYVFSPPARSPEDQTALWRALANGTLDAVTSDHSPFSFVAQKSLGREDFALIPNGIGGIEERIMLLHEFGVRRGRLSLTRWVDLVATGPARAFGMAPRKGTLAPGADADIVIFDPERERLLTVDRLQSASDYTPYEGITVHGAPEHVFVRGVQVVRHGTLTQRPPSGGFLARAGAGGDLAPRLPIAA